VKLSQMLPAIPFVARGLLSSRGPHRRRRRGRIGQHTVTNKTESIPRVVGSQAVRTLLFLGLDVSRGDAHDTLWHSTGLRRAAIARMESLAVGAIEGLILASEALGPLTAREFYPT